MAKLCKYFGGCNYRALVNSNFCSDHIDNPIKVNKFNQHMIMVDGYLSLSNLQGLIRRHSLQTLTNLVRIEPSSYDNHAVNNIYFEKVTNPNELEEIALVEAGSKVMFKKDYILVFETRVFYSDRESTVWVFKKRNDNP